MDAGRQYWIFVLASSDTPVCHALGYYTPRQNGSFSTTATTQSFSNFSIWGSSGNYSAAPSGDTKCFILATDEAGANAGKPIWFQQNKICFTKTCS